MYSIKISPITKQNETPYHFLQTRFWASFKAMHDWTPYFFEGTATKADNSIINFNITVLVRKLKTFISIAYIPLGIELPKSAQYKQNLNCAAVSDKNSNHITYNSKEYLFLLQDTARELKKLLPPTVFCIRFDPPIEFFTNEERIEYLRMYKKTDIDEKVLLKKSPTDIQPPDTVLLQLDKTEEELLSAMKPKWRYNIRLAEKKGVNVRAAGAESIDSFYKVFMETAARDRIAVHGKDYYKSLLELSADGSHVKTTLYIAEHEGETLAGIITLFTNTEAVYLYGASSDNKRNLMPAYLLQWTAIQDAKKFGSKVYDFYGIPPTDDENHPMHGLYRFKTGFGGTVVHRAGSLDMPVKPAFYAFYILLEKLRAFYFKKIRKLLKHR
ncbi:MAG: peptidoglycan bridge formation glycyltransferase FemA/FemB family protein [Treponemataceae bacterium]|nr:peptidoglycan bridge formation glycyltransferase FemA/FemB family protein [Treponemataceae bacterium]